MIDELEAVKVYAESSAVLTWLLGESRGIAVVEILRRASAVYASELTLVEVDRGIDRSMRDGRLNEVQGVEARALLNRAASSWTLLAMTGDVIDRARRPFPGEPIRSLDAIHLASALAIREAVGPIRLLSLDERLRRSAHELGFEVVPALGDTIHEPPGSGL